MELWMIVVIAAAAIVVLAIIIAILATVLRKYTISFKTGVVKYTTEVPVIKARKGAAIELPVLASRDYDFKGWYTDAQCISPANFEKNAQGRHDFVCRLDEKAGVKARAKTAIRGAFVGSGRSDSSQPGVQDRVGLVECRITD